MNKSNLQEILLGCEVMGKTDTQFEDARIYEDIPRWVNYLHEHLVKPISKWGSSKILRKEILSACGDMNGKTVIDVSVGDDEAILELSKGSKKAVANDIVECTMDNLKRVSKGITFSCLNLLDIDGRQKFDVVLCKNTLHHLNTIPQIEKALKKLKQLKNGGGKIVIMDIEKPSLSLKARLWNAYYVFMLKDQGGFFITYDQFVDMLGVCYSGMTIKTRKVETIKGTYMLAEIY